MITAIRRPFAVLAGAAAVVVAALAGGGVSPLPGHAEIGCAAGTDVSNGYVTVTFSRRWTGRSSARS